MPIYVMYDGDISTSCPEPFPTVAPPTSCPERSGVASGSVLKASSLGGTWEEAGSLGRTWEAAGSEVPLLSTVPMARVLPLL